MSTPISIDYEVNGAIVSALQDQIEDGDLHKIPQFVIRRRGEFYTDEAGRTVPEFDVYVRSQYVDTERLARDASGKVPALILATTS